MSEELPIEVPARWTVVTVYHRQSKEEREIKATPKVKHHELHFNNRSHERDTGERGRRRLQEMADLFNRMKVEPRTAAVECLADDSGSIESRLAKQNRRCKTPGISK